MGQLLSHETGAHPSHRWGKYKKNTTMNTITNIKTNTNTNEDFLSGIWKRIFNPRFEEFRVLEI